MNERLRYSRHHCSIALIYQIIAVVLISVFLIFAVNVVNVPLANLLVLVLIFGRLVPSSSGLIQGWQQIRNMLPAFAAVKQFNEAAIDQQEVMIQERSESIPLETAITFRDVSFRYRGKDAYVLRNASFDIPAKKTTVIVGPSGSGKTTLADLLIGLLNPESGRIFVDDQLVNDKIIPQWRQSVGYVPQDPFLFHDTIRFNLLWAKPAATEVDMWKSLEQASANEFVKNLPQGLDTIVGDRGLSLSGGERQRIVLARTLLSSPSILLLDEATSALDIESEERILAAIDLLHKKMSVVIITHRPSDRHQVDIILQVESGGIVTQRPTACSFR